MTVKSECGATADLSVSLATLSLLLLSVLKELGHGRGVAVIATDTKLTTQQAADILQVSRPYFVKLLTEGRIPVQTVGSRRRVRIADLLQYYGNELAVRHSGLDELVDEAQKLGMY
ncbi:MAG: helix-turn-helix domain-containing protein [Capsulimonadaceae bacterium]